MSKLQPASGSVKINNQTSYIAEGHGRVVPEQVISKSVPGRGRVFYKVTSTGGLVEIK
jgi:hypothetical protein